MIRCRQVSSLYIKLSLPAKRSRTRLSERPSVKASGCERNVALNSVEQDKNKAKSFLMGNNTQLKIYLIRPTWKNCFLAKINK